MRSLWHQALCTGLDADVVVAHQVRTPNIVKEGEPSGARRFRIAWSPRQYRSTCGVAELATDCRRAYRLTPQFSLRVLRGGVSVQVQGTGRTAIRADLVGPDRLEVKAAMQLDRDADGLVVSDALLQGKRL